MFDRHSEIGSEIFLPLWKCYSHEVAIVKRMIIDWCIASFEGVIIFIIMWQEEEMISCDNYYTREKIPQMHKIFGKSSKE